MEVRLRKQEDPEGPQSSILKRQIDEQSNPHASATPSGPKITTPMHVADEDIRAEDVDEPVSKVVKSKCNVGIDDDKNIMSSFAAAKKRKLLGVQAI